MIQAIIFDVGGVLLRTEDRAPRQQWEAKLGLPPGGAEALVFNSAMGQQAQRGAITEPELWQWIGAHLDLSVLETAAFRRGFWSGDKLDTGLVALIRQLKTRYQTAIISNYASNLRDELTNQFQIADAFDEIIISCEEKVMKPDPEIFHRALGRLGRQPREAVFIDDFQHNVAAAEAVGLAAIHFQPGLDLAHALQQLGISSG
ncbi:MAG: HAD-IA family hydrolase [Anaerolineales bacterium]|nr:HAD-IA family hydrolase [Anaerolineales bacterium]MCB8940017.1 HAD-IA family hydrolase [Ardenticatenaceae bacterium]